MLIQNNLSTTHIKNEKLIEKESGHIDTHRVVN